MRDQFKYRIGTDWGCRKEIPRHHDLIKFRDKIKKPTITRHNQTRALDLCQKVVVRKPLDYIIMNNNVILL